MLSCDGAETRFVKGSVIKNNACGRVGDNPIQPCQVSLFRILNSPDDFDGKYVQVVGYSVAMSGESYLFVTEDHAVARDYSSSVATIASDKRLPPGLVRLIGKFSAVPHVPAEGERQGGRGKSFGSFVEIYSYSGAEILPSPKSVEPEDLPEKGALDINEAPGEVAEN